MPYDKDGKYYRQPVYNKNFSSDSPVKKNSKKRKINEDYEWEKKQLAREEEWKKDQKIIRNMFAGFGIFILVIAIPHLMSLNKVPRRVEDNKVPTRVKDNKKVPSAEETLADMLKYQKQKDARRRQEQIIDNFIFKEMNSW